MGEESRKKSLHTYEPTSFKDDDQIKPWIKSF